MSLFDFRRLIEFNVSGKFDPRSVICLADQSQIVVGTFDGRLELYAPSESEQLSLVNSIQVNSAILQVKEFKYNNDERTKSVVVLCARKMLGVKIVENDMKFIFEHKFNSDQYSVDCGGSNDVGNQSDYLYSLALNGQLSLFQNETKIFQVDIPNMLLPSPLSYSPKQDSIFIQQKPFTVSSFLQNTLAIMAESQKTKFVAQWECDLPELIIEMNLIDTKSTLFCSGTQSVYLVSAESGQVLTQVQIEGIRINSMHAFLNNGDLMQLYTTENNQLLIYNGTTRIWSSSTNMEIIGVKRICSGVLEGALLMLGRQWQLRVGYLGTRPELKMLASQGEKNSFADLNREISEAEAILSDQTEQIDDRSTKNAFSLNVMLNPSLHNPRVVDFKIGITPNVELELITLSLIPPTDDFEIEFIDGDELSMSKQSVTGCLVIPEQSFLNLNLSISVSVQTIEGDHQTRVVDEELPPVTWLKKLETLNEHDHHNLNETLKLTVKSDRVVQLSSLFSDYSIESSTFDSQNQIHFSLPQNQHISVRSNKNEIELSSQSAVSMLLILKLISRRIREAKQNCEIIQNPKFENRIYSNFESRMEHLNILNEADGELKSKLQDQMKFLTALEKKLLVKIKLKNQLQESSMEYLIEQTLISISEQRRALVENQKLKRQYELESMASIQLILISSFSRYVSLDLISQMLGNFNLEAINAPFMTKIEAFLSFIGSRLGQSSGSAGTTTNGATQVDVKRIKKRLHSILTRLSESAVANLFSSKNKMKKVPLKSASGDSPLAQNPKPTKLNPLKPLSGGQDQLPNLKPVNTTPVNMTPNEDTPMPPVKPKREVPEDFEEHMRLLQNQ